MRRAVLAASLAVSLAAPAAATADPLTVGRDKLRERVAAECGRHDLSGATGCATRPAQTQVDAHRGSPLARVLAFQRALGDGLPFADAPWVGTHNSFNTPAEDPTLSHTDSNQQLTVLQQLDVDVRSVELDVHWMPTHRDGGGFAPVVCHGQGPAGCTTERTLGSHLRDIAGWLDREENAGEVLLLYLEDQLAIPDGPDVPARYATAAQVVRDTLGSRVFKPRGDGDGGCKDLSLELTRQAVRAAGKQVVIVGSCGQGAWRAVSHAWPSSVRFEARPRGWTCAQVPRDNRLVRFFEDSTFLGSLQPDDGLTPETVREMMRCGVDLLGFDQLVPGDGRLEATVWSWANGVDWEGATAAVQRKQEQGARWEPVAPSGERPAACRRPGGTWVLSAPVASSEAAPACEALGATWAPPRTGAENAALAVAGGEGAWLALSPAAAVVRTASRRARRIT